MNNYKKAKIIKLINPFNHIIKVKSMILIILAGAKIKNKNLLIYKVKSNQI